MLNVVKYEGELTNVADIELQKLEKSQVKLEMKKELQKLEDARTEMNNLQNNYKEHYLDCLVMSLKVDELLDTRLIQKRECDGHAYELTEEERIRLF